MIDGLPMVENKIQISYEMMMNPNKRPEIQIMDSRKMKNYNSKREDNKEEDQPEDERNVIL